MTGMKIKKIDLFIIISLSCTAVFLIMLIVTKGAAAEWLAIGNYFDGAYTDYFRQICYVSDLKNFYFTTNDAPFPPFAYMLYYLLLKLNPPEEPWEIMAWDDVMGFRYNMLIFIMLTIMVVLAFKLMTDLCLPEEGKVRTTVFTAALLLSAPFMAGSIERGNIVFLVVVLLIAALYLKDSKSAAGREAALIFIALAAGIKIYPAVAGFIYIKERRWKEGIRLLIYGLIVFFVPFVFVGGIPTMVWYYNFMLLYGNQSYCGWTNIRNVLLSISRMLGQYENSLSFVIYFKIAENLYLLLCLLSLFKTKKKWKQALYTAGVMALYVPASFRYVSCYMAIPLIMYLREKPEEQKMVYCILFAATFTIPFYGYFTGIEADFFIFLPVYIMMFYSFIEEWILSAKNQVIASKIQAI